LRLDTGEVAEWPNVPDSKSGVPQGTVGSNPTLSASYDFYGFQEVQKTEKKPRNSIGYGAFLFFNVR
jgi:hypothetical protein